MGRRPRDMDRVHTAGIAVAAVIFSFGCETTSRSVGDSCQPAQLSAEVSGPDGTGGEAEYRITISDHGSACTLHGAPKSLEGIDASGQAVRLHPTGVSADDLGAMTTGSPANLTRGRTADVVLLTSIACPAAEPNAAPSNNFRSLRLGIGTGTLDVPFGHGPEPFDTVVSLPCGVAMSAFYASFVDNP
jgi:hypothetical protein